MSLGWPRFAMSCSMVWVLLQGLLFWMPLKPKVGSVEADGTLLACSWFKQALSTCPQAPNNV
jgi:hypothetical protein